MKKFTTILLLGLMLITTYCTKNTTDPDPMNDDQTEWQIKIVVEPSCIEWGCPYSLPFSVHYNTIVNWGDGTIDSDFSDHIYAEKKTYTIKINNIENATIEGFNTSDSGIKEIYFKGITIRHVSIDYLNIKQNNFSILDIDDCEIEVLGVLPTKLEYLDLKGVKKLSYLYVHGDGGGARTTIRNLHTCGDLTNLILYGVNAGIVSLPECPLLKQLHITHCAAESIMLGQSSNLYDINVMCNHLSASNILSLLNHWNPRSNHQPHDMFLAWGNPGWPNAKATVSAQTLAKVGVAGQTCNCPCLEDGTER